MFKKQRESMRRKVPTFYVQLNGGTYETFSQHPTVQKIVIEELVFAIKDGINKNKKSVSLFELKDSSLLIELDKKNWKQSLNNALNYFIQKEDYNKCIEIRDLINKI